jgi:hypothetical protein
LVRGGRPLSSGCSARYFFVGWWTLPSESRFAFLQVHLVLVLALTPMRPTTSLVRSIAFLLCSCSPRVQGLLAISKNTGFTTSRLDGDQQSTCKAAKWHGPGSRPRVRISRANCVFRSCISVTVASRRSC